MLNTQQLLYLIPFILCLLLLFWIYRFAWSRRNVPGALEFSFHVLSQFIWILGFVLELTSQQIQWKLFWDDIQWACTVLAAVTYAVFILRYVKGVKLTKHQVIFVGAVVSPLVLFSVSDVLHHSIRSNIRLEASQPFSALLYDFDMGFYVTAIPSFLITIMGIFLLVVHIFQSQREFHKQSISILIGISIPFLGSVLTMLGYNFYIYRDTSPFTFSAGSLVVLWGLLRYGLFDLVPVALRKVLDTINDIVFVLDNQERLIFINKIGADRIDIDLQGGLGKPIRDAFRAYTKELDLFSSVYEAEEELTFADPEGNPQTFRLKILPLNAGDGTPRGRVVVLSDISHYKKLTEQLHEHKEEAERLVEERTAQLEDRNQELLEEVERRIEAEKEITSNLEEKTLLIREIQHRVQNNMSIILSLLNIQAQYLEGSEAIKPLAGIHNRIFSMSAAHTIMYQNNNFKHIPMQEYASRLYANINPGRRQGLTIDFKAELGQWDVPVDQAVPLGLFLNEALSNAVMHAFPDGETGEIRVSRENSMPDENSVVIADNGVGLAEQVFKQKETFGLKIMSLLAEQLGGKLTMTSQKGTRVTLTFPK